MIGLLLLGLGCAPPAVCTVEAVRQVGILDQEPIVDGRDGGGSGPAFGGTVFAFGDTVLRSADAAGETWHHNSFAYTEDDDASDGIGPLTAPVDAAGAPIYLVAPTADEEAYNAAHRGDPCAVAPCGARLAVWPDTPAWDAEGGQALVLYGLIHAEPGDFNFYGLGQSIGIWTDPGAPVDRPLLSPASDHPTLLWPRGARAPTSALQITEDRVLAFSCAEDGWDHPCLLMAAPRDAVLERSAWRFWDGSGWTDEVDEAEVLFDGAPILSLVYAPAFSAWLIVYSDPLSDDVVLRSAPALTGPWSRELLLFVAAPGDREGWVYDAAVHPTFVEEGGRVLTITWSQARGDTWFGTQAPVLQVELRPR